jgi:hypothetical protein
MISRLRLSVCARQVDQDPQESVHLRAVVAASIAHWKSDNPQAVQLIRLEQDSCECSWAFSIKPSSVVISFRFGWWSQSEYLC